VPGYIRGFVEREFADGWTFVCRVDPFTGSQGTFKYLMFSSRNLRFLDPPPHTEGFPDDLAPETKLAILGRYLPSLDRLSDQDLEKKFEEEKSKKGYKRHATLGQLSRFDWDRGISYENWEQLYAEVIEDSSSQDLSTHELTQLLDLFELVDIDGIDYGDWETTTDGPRGWRRQAVEDGLFEDLLSWELVTFQDRSVRLRKRTRREMLPDHWFRLLATLERASYGREVRFIFFWEH
jgi:hypothetical protein